MKVKSRGLIYVSCILLATIQQLSAKSDTLMNDHDVSKVLISQKQQLQQQQQPKFHPTMSCYACSTMDQENPADSICKTMKGYHRTPSTYQPQLPNNIGGYHHQLMNAPNHHQQHQQQQQHEQLATTEINPSNGHQNEMTNTQIDNNQQHYPSVNPTSSRLTMLNNQNSSITEDHAGHDHSLHNINSQYGYNSQLQRHLSQTGYIRTRPCSEDENFCSIVSVVRIEFVNDSMLSRFWALERNCSKSCNTGCMLIGERVRLRVCSQCCRTPNCNIGSGSASLYHLNLSHFAIPLSLPLVIWILVLIHSFSSICINGSI